MKVKDFNGIIDMDDERLSGIGSVTDTTPVVSLIVWNFSISLFIYLLSILSLSLSFKCVLGLLIRTTPRLSGIGSVTDTTLVVSLIVCSGDARVHVSVLVLIVVVIVAAVTSVCVVKAAGAAASLVLRDGHIVRVFTDGTASASAHLEISAHFDSVIIICSSSTLLLLLLMMLSVVSLIWIVHHRSTAAAPTCPTLLLLMLRRRTSSLVLKNVSSSID